MGLTSEGRRYNPPHMLPAASPPAVEINGQPAPAYLSPKLQTHPVTPEGPKSALHTLLLTAALIFAAATVVYSCVWMYYVRLRLTRRFEKRCTEAVALVFERNSANKVSLVFLPGRVF